MKRNMEIQIGNWVQVRGLRRGFVGRKHQHYGSYMPRGVGATERLYPERLGLSCPGPKLTRKPI